MCGDLLALSGWTTALTEAGIASRGRSDSSLKVAHFTKTTRAHQVNAAALYKLQHVAFQELIGTKTKTSFKNGTDDLRES